jgi:predicted metal-dependent hydrolase
MLLADESRTFAAGDEMLAYTLRRTGRRRTVGIYVEPDRRLVVLAPAGTATERVERMLQRRLPWIRRQWRELEALSPPPAPRQWVSGETHRYLGRQYRLKLVSSPERSVKLTGGYFRVTLPNPRDPAAVRKLMESWYRARAVALVHERVRRVLSATTWLDVDMPPISIRTLTHRWGSTTRAGRITFNVDLVKLPLPCIDYVVTHELVHLKIPNHSPAYWRLLGRVMPDWEKWREKLGRVEV